MRTTGQLGCSRWYREHSTLVRFPGDDSQAAVDDGLQATSITSHGFFPGPLHDTSLVDLFLFFAVFWQISGKQESNRPAAQNRMAKCIQGSHSQKSEHFSPGVKMVVR